MAEKNRKERLDLILTERGFYRSRSQAKRAIMAGEVRVDNEVIDKAGTKFVGMLILKLRRNRPLSAGEAKNCRKLLISSG